MNATVDATSSGRVCEVERSQSRFAAAKQRADVIVAPSKAPNSRLSGARGRARAFATCTEAVVGPRQPSLPESWDARSLDDDAISEELQRLKLNQRPLTRNLSTRRIRTVRNRRLKFRAHSTSSSKNDAEQDLGQIKEGKYLTSEQQAALCAKWQEWQRVQECIPPLTGTEAEHKEAWAKAANLTVSELNRIEGDAFLAAHLMLASVESLLRGICWKYVYRVRGVDIEDVMAEARSLWLDAAAQCDFSKATLNSFGTMFVSQRLYKIMDRNSSLLERPPSSLQDELRVERVKTALQSSLSREPTVQEIAKQAGMTKINVENVLKRLKTTTSIDSPVPGRNTSDDEGLTTADNLTSDASPDSETVLTPIMRSEMEGTLKYLMDKNIKDDQTRKMCDLYYGFDGNQSRTLRDIGSSFGVSIETVRKKLVKARAHLNKNEELRKEMSPYLEEGLLSNPEEGSPSRITDLTAQSQSFDV